MGSLRWLWLLAPVVLWLLVQGYQAGYAATEGPVSIAPVGFMQGGLWAVPGLGRCDGLPGGLRRVRSGAGM